MYLDSVGRYNNLSVRLREELEARIASFGKHVRYKFHISNPNPHPDMKGQPVWPSIWTLDPKIFNIQDPYAEKGKGSTRYIGLVENVNEKGDPDMFHTIRLREGDRGVFFLDLETDEGRQTAMFLELHPKNGNGLFPNKNVRLIFERIDEKQAAVDKRKERSERVKALSVAEGMSEKEVRQFAAAMLWDEAEDMDILRGRVEEAAETAPKLFNDLVESKQIEIRASIKRAMDSRILSFDPSEYKFIWVANGQTAAMLQMNETKSEVELLADWVQTGGDIAKKMYDKMKSLLKGEAAK